MKINGNEIRPNMIINHNGKLYKAVKTQHVKPGKGGAYLQAELKDIINGTKLNERFRSDQAIERAVLEQKECQFSYIDQDFYIFMDQKTFEQINLAKNEIPENQLPYIQDGIIVTIEFYEEKALGIVLPPSMVFEVMETEAVIKGQTASSSYKPAILDNGIRTAVPPHIAMGDKIVINTEDSSYIERFKE